jgi:hypothetical protein
VVAVDVETIKIHTMIVSRNMSGAITMVPMTTTTMINAMVVVAYIVVGVVMAAETLKETILTMHLEPMILVRCVARWVTLH